MKLIQALGIDWKILLAQFVNFGVLVFVLYKFGSKPILKFLDERSKMIEEGVRDAQIAKEKVHEMNEKEKKVISGAKAEARIIIQKAEEAAKKNREEIMKKAEKEAEEAIESAKKKIERERNKIMEDVKSEISTLVISAAEKVTDEKIDTAKDKKLIEKAIEG